MAGPVKRAGSLSQTDPKGNEIGKVFVGGLSWDTNEDSLKEAFSKFGEVTDCIVMRNAETGNSRGFGFLTFRDSDSVEMVLAGGPHMVDERHVDAKACNKKIAAAQRNKKAPGGKENKVFVGGLPIDVTEDAMRDFFNQFGNVTEVLIMFNQQKQRPRGFGFVSFDGEESIEHLVEQHYLTMNGKQIEIKRAEPRFNKPGFEGGAMGGAPEPWMTQGAGDIWGGGVDQYAMNGAGAGAYPAADYSQYAQAGAGYPASTAAAYQQAWSQVASQAGGWPQGPSHGGPAMAGYGQQPAAAYGWPPQTAAPQGYAAYGQQPPAGYGAAPGGQPGQGPPAGYPGAAAYGAPPAGPPGPPGQGPSAPQGAYGQESSGFGPQRGGYGSPPGPASGAAGQGMYGVDGGAPGYGPPGGAVQPSPPGYGGGAPGGDPNAGYGRPPAGGGGGGQPGYHPYRR